MDECLVVTEQWLSEHRAQLMRIGRKRRIIVYLPVQLQGIIVISPAKVGITLLFQQLALRYDCLQLLIWYASALTIATWGLRLGGC